MSIMHFIWAFLMLLCLAAVWDIGRRALRIFSERNAHEDQRAGEAALKLEERVRVLENGQRELLARIAGASQVVSRFQRKA